MQIEMNSTQKSNAIPWNKGRITGQKPPLRQREVWAIRVRLRIEGRDRDLACSTWRSTASWQFEIVAKSAS